MCLSLLPKTLIYIADKFICMAVRNMRVGCRVLVNNTCAQYSIIIYKLYYHYMTTIDKMNNYIPQVTYARTSG